MKKLSLLLVLLVFGVLTCNAQKKKQFFYKGIELHGVKGWTVLPSQDDNITKITCYKDELQMQLTKRGLPQNFNAERMLERVVERQMEQNLSASRKSPRIKMTSEVREGYINNIPAKYVDIEYTKDIAKRIYIFSTENQLFTIICTGTGRAEKSIENFSKILSSFVYIPEPNSQSLFF